MSTFGSSYNADLDGPRIALQHESIRDLMLDGAKRTLGDIACVLGYPEASISAQLRHLRKARFGGWNVQKERVARGGLWTYWIDGKIEACVPTTESHDAALGGVPDPYVRVVSALIFNNHGDLLVQRRSPTASRYPGYWEVPGGKVDPGETPAEAMRRELYEEIGVEMTVFVEHPVLELVLPTPIMEIDVHISFHLCGINGAPRPLEGQTDLRYSEACIPDGPGLVSMPILAEYLRTRNMRQAIKLKEIAHGIRIDDRMSRK